MVDGWRKETESEKSEWKELSLQTKLETVAMEIASGMVKTSNR